MLMISEMLRIEQIQLSLRSSDKASVLRELVELVPETKSDRAQQDSFVQALLEREKLHTTGIGDGIALPHARNPLGGLLKRPLLVFGRHNTGIEYGCMDSKPAQLFFLLASPNLTDHLGMLARLSRVLRDTKLRGFLLQLKKADEVISGIKEAESRLAK